MIAHADAAEFVVYLDTCDPLRAAQLRAAQCAEGFTAYQNNVPFQNARPQAWQRGWLAACRSEIVAILQELSDAD